MDINNRQYDIIQEQKVKIEEYEAQEKARYIFKIPFTDLGVTTEHIQGAAVTVIIFLIL